MFGMFRVRTRLSILALIPVIFLITACGKQPAETVSYTNDIRPILEANCLDCHVVGQRGYEKSGLDMETYHSLIKGTKFGPVIKAGDSISSTLAALIEGRVDPSIKMPHGGRDPLTAAEIKKIRDWIDQGASNN